VTRTVERRNNFLNRSNQGNHSTDHKHLHQWHQ